MDDLIELIVRGIIKWMSAPKAERPVRPALSRPVDAPPPSTIDPGRIPNLPPAWQEQLRQVILSQQPRKVKGRRPAPPVVVAEAPVKVVQAAPPVVAAAPMRASTRQAVGSVTASLHRQLTPRVLREQYILTEVLQPPLALREQR